MKKVSPQSKFIMPYYRDVSDIIKQIEKNLKKLNPDSDLKEIEKKIWHPIEVAFEQSDDKPKLYKRLSLKLHPDKLALCQDGVAQCLRTFKLPSTDGTDGTDILSLPQQILNECYHNPHTSTQDMPAPVYTNDPYCSSRFKDVQGKLYLLCVAAIVLEATTGISQTTSLAVLTPVMLSIFSLEPQKRKELCDVGIGAINSVTAYCGNFFASKINTTKTEKGDVWIDPDTFIVREEEDYLIVDLSPCNG